MTSQAILHKIKGIQTECLKLVFKNKNPWTLCLKHGILPLDKLIQLELLKTSYKLQNSLLPKPVLYALKTDQSGRNLTKTHQYGTRNKAMPNNPKAHSKQYKSSFLCKAVTEYASFVVTTAHCKNLKHFIATCKKHLGMTGHNT